MDDLLMVTYYALQAIRSPSIVFSKSTLFVVPRHLIQYHLVRLKHDMSCTWRR